MVEGNRHCMVCERAGPFPRFWRPPGSEWSLVRCPGCGLVFQDPQPGEQVLQDSYYHDPEFTRLLFGPLRELTLSRAREKLSWLEDAGVVSPGRRGLDVGCSSGAWLEVAQASGMRMVGLEIGSETAEAARRRGLDVRTGSLPQRFSELAGERFDLITFWDVLEHVRDPQYELTLAGALLAPDGVLAVSFPNIEGWYPRLTYRLLARPTGVWEYPELPVHLYDFAPSTARRLLERSGFTLQRLKTMPVPFSFYRTTTLAPQRLGGGGRAMALRSAFEALRLLVYPLARLFDRQNAMFVLASLGNGSPGSPAPGSR